jgi:hypothetical protein
MPHRSLYPLDDFEDMAVRSKTEEKNKFFFRINESGKEHVLHDSTNVVIWALLEAVEIADDK